MKEAYKFDFEKGEFVFKNKDAVVLTGYDALKQWIEKCIRTQLNRTRCIKAQATERTLRTW